MRDPAEVFSSPKAASIRQPSMKRRLPRPAEPRGVRDINVEGATGYEENRRNLSALCCSDSAAPLTSRCVSIAVCREAAADDSPGCSRGRNPGSPGPPSESPARATETGHFPRPYRARREMVFPPRVPPAAAPWAIVRRRFAALQSNAIRSRARSSIPFTGPATTSRSPHPCRAPATGARGGEAVKYSARYVVCPARGGTTVAPAGFGTRQINSLGIEQIDASAC
jgi:hypothetical protein